MFIHVSLLLQMKNVAAEANWRLINLPKEMFLIKHEKERKCSEWTFWRKGVVPAIARPSRLFFVDISSSLGSSVRENKQNKHSPRFYVLLIIFPLHCLSAIIVRYHRAIVALLAGETWTSFLRPLFTHNFISTAWNNKTVNMDGRAELWAIKSNEERREEKNLYWKLLSLKLVI